jgi:hypothetical protein
MRILANFKNKRKRGGRGRKWPYILSSNAWVGQCNVTLDSDWPREHHHRKSDRSVIKEKSKGKEVPKLSI